MIGASATPPSPKGHGRIMIESLELLKFRTCENVHLDLDELTVLLGYNGAGKSNILHSIVWAAGGGVAPGGLVGDDNGHVTMRLRLAGGVYVYEVKRFEEAIKLEDGNWDFRPHVYERLYDAIVVDSPPLLERVDEEITLNGRSSLRIPMDSPAIPTTLAFYVGEDAAAINGFLAEVDTFLKGITYYPLKAANPGSASGRMYSWLDYSDWKKRGKKSLDSDTDVNLRLLDAWLNNSDGFAEAEQLLGQSGLGVLSQIRIRTYLPSDPNDLGRPFRVHDSLPDNSGTKAIFAVGFVAPNRPNWEAIRFRELSMGTQRIVQLIVHFLFDASTMALLEQPEDALHPSLLKKVMSLIASYSSEAQCVVTSHSPDVFNLTSPERIRIVELSEEGKTSATPLSSDQIGQAREYMRNDGTLAEYLAML